MEKLKLFNYKIKPRAYQENIARVASKKNTLCILPTGLGKTLIAILVAAYRLEKLPRSKVLMLAPTRPLVNQHYKTFKDLLNLNSSEFIVLTGKIRPDKRKNLYVKGRIFFATPQVIRNDLNNGFLTLNDFSLLIVDECHRSVKKYAYTQVVEKYVQQSPFPLILGLTASPGGVRDKIEEVKKNLHIEKVEIRTREDLDVKPYIKRIKFERVYVELPEEFLEIRELLDQALKERLELLLNYQLLTSTKTTKKQLLELQNKLGKRYEETNRDPIVARALLACAQAIKIEHAIDLLETQGITPLYKYLTGLRSKLTYATKGVLSDPKIIEATRKVKELYVKGIEHPKLEKILHIVKDEIKENPRTKIIIFANYRSSVEKIVKTLQAEGIEAKEFIGQAKKEGKGLKQKEQIQILNEFKYELFNVLVATSVGEEGLDIEEVDTVIFYEPVPSEIRSIQRRGRTGRTKTGKVIFLITKGTRDEGYYWSAFHKERRMRGILFDMKRDEKKTLLDWLQS